MTKRCRFWLGKDAGALLALLRFKKLSHYLPGGGLYGFVVVLSFVPSVESLAQKVRETSEKSKHRIPFERAAREYKLQRIGADDTAILVKPALLNWTNPVRMTSGGAVFAWTVNGKPEAVCCMYTYLPQNSDRHRVDHEWVCLSRERLEARYGNEVVWIPSGSAVTWKLMAGARSPLKSRRARLVQMRRLATQFSAVIGKQDREELRLLTQPIYRYPADGQRDGAIFAFVQATDPEALLLLEVGRSDDDADHWVYGVARMTSYPVRVTRNDEEVYAVERYGWNRHRPPSETFHVRSDVLWPDVFKASEAKN